jgi:hypothetical protein
MNALLRAAERVPNWFRATSILALPLVAYWAASQKAPLPSTVFVAWSAIVLAVHAPVFFFDGPLPVSSLGVHHSGDIHSWDDVVRIEPLGDKDLQAVLADGQTVQVRVKGRRTREDLREAISAHKPASIAF